MKKHCGVGSQPASEERGSVRGWRAMPRMGLLAVLCAWSLAGCGGNSPKSIAPPYDPPPPTTAPPTATQSGTVTITPSYIALAPGQSYPFKAAVIGGGTLQWLVNGVAGGSSATGTVDALGNYTAPATMGLSENVTVTAELASSPSQNYATSVVALIQPAHIACPDATGNPQVAQYAIYLPAPGQISIQFGKTTEYGQSTWQARTPSPYGGYVPIYVAGMLAQTLYHMQAQVTLDNGASYTDSDHTCTTGQTPTLAALQVTPIAGGNPQPGIQLWNTFLPGNLSSAFATDLNGNVIWTYTFKHLSAEDRLQSIQLLPNGNMLTMASPATGNNTSSGGTVGSDDVREIDLAGNIVRDLSMTTLDQEMAASNLRDASGNTYSLQYFHHDVLALPNGHWLLLTSMVKNCADIPGCTGTDSIIGDVLVDVDQNLIPDWVWNTFDHLDVNRRPMNFPDWTHSNAMLYSSDDHNLLLSIRHQNWILKIDYLDGTGSGKILWTLGYQGDFTLQGATAPTDWFYAQHGMNYFSFNTTGDFKLGMMDNGNDRVFPTGQVQCPPGAAVNPSCYSTMTVLELNENNRTATMLTHYAPGPQYYSYFGGQAQLLENGDTQVDFCATTKGAIVQELNPQATQVEWEGSTPNSEQYRVLRLPSLYPGVQW